MSFGNGPLSHPLLVEAIEDCFVPVAVHNNRGGADAAALKRFDEPSWNNPVVRFLDGRARDILPRADRVWSTHAVAARMVEALATADHDVPDYLELAALEARVGARAGLERATFAMYCFWTGEATLGALDGVAATRPGWLEGKEVVEVVYDPARLAYADLLAHARRHDCATTVYAHTAGQERIARAAAADTVRTDDVARDAKDSDRTRHLNASPLRYLPLTPLQATKVNAALAEGRSPRRWLSPRQAALVDEVLAAHEDGRLDGLARPRTIGGLAEYQARLERRLAP